MSRIFGSGGGGGRGVKRPPPGQARVKPLHIGAQLPSTLGPQNWKIRLVILGSTSPSPEESALFDFVVQMEQIHGETQILNPRTAGEGQISTPLRFFADSEKTAARSAAKFAIAVQPTIWHI